MTRLVTTQDREENLKKTYYVSKVLARRSEQFASDYLGCQPSHWRRRDGAETEEVMTGTSVVVMQLCVKSDNA